MFALIILALSIVTALSIYIPAKPIILDPNLRGIKKITKDGWLLLTAMLFLIILPLAQYYYQQFLDSKKEEDVKKALDIRDKANKKSYDSSLRIMKSSFDTSNQRITTIISTTLGKYGFKLDSATKTLKRETDSLKINSMETPVLMLDKFNGEEGISYLKHESGKFHYAVNFVSVGAASSRYQLSYSVVVKDSVSGFTYITYDPKPNLLPYYQFMNKEGGSRTTFNVNDNSRFNYVYLWIRGTYCNYDGTKKYSNLNTVYYNNRNGNVFGTMTGATRDSVIACVKRNEHIK